MTKDRSTACPVCGADGVKGCSTADGSDHEGRPPFFDANVQAVLNSMARAEREAGR